MGDEVAHSSPSSLPSGLHPTSSEVNNERDTSLAGPKMREADTANMRKHDQQSSDSAGDSALASALADVECLRTELEASRIERDRIARKREEEVMELCETLQEVEAECTELRTRLIQSEELRVEVRRRAASRAPAERVMRRAFAEKVEQLALTHARTTARMLNVQKRCFEEELESLESEAHATVVAFERQFAKIREEAANKDEDHAREREAAFAKTAAVMDAVKRRIESADKALDMAKKGRKRAEGAARERHEALVRAVKERENARSEIGRMHKQLDRKNAVISRLQEQLDTVVTTGAENFRPSKVNSMYPKRLII